MAMKRWLLCFVMLWVFSLMGKDLCVTWKFAHEQLGFQYAHKLVLTVDGDTVTESSVYIPNERGQVCLTLPEGKHQLDIQALVYFESEWEPYLIASNYGLNARFSDSVEVSTKNQLNLVFDVAQAKTLVSWKSISDVSCMTEKHSLFIEWAYHGLVNGYVYPNRVEVFVDGVLLGISESVLQSDTGRFELQLPKGKHSIRVSTYCWYNNRWEAQTIQNGYSVDGFYRGKHRFRAHEQLVLLMDISDGGTKVEWE
jgi:hypothetical protein